MNGSRNSLHILTPVSPRRPRQLQEEGLANPDNLIADFRHFPPSVWQIRSDGALDEITACLVQSRDYWTPVREWLADFTARTGLQDVLQVEGFGVWWTLNAQKFVPGLTEVGNAFVWIDLLRGVTQRSLNAVVIYGRHETIIHLAQQIFPPDVMRVMEETCRGSEAHDRPPRRPFLLLARVLLGIVYLLYSLFTRPDVCLFSNTNLVRRATDRSEKELRDVYLGSVARSLRRRGQCVTVVEKYGWNASWAGLMARRFFFPSDLIYALTSPMVRALRRSQQADQGWRTAWTKVRATVKSNLRYRGCDIAPLVLPTIADQFTRKMPVFADQTRLWRRILSLWEPRLVYVNNAYGGAALAPIIAAKILGIPTIEQQHGVIGRNHFAYLVPNRLESAAKFTLCDRMAVWGEYTKSFLVDHQVYKPSDLTVTGFPRIDRLLTDLPARQEILKTLGASADASVVLYTPNRFAEAFRSSILDSIAAAGDRHRIQWIVKPHPAMDTSKIWREEISKRRLQNVGVVSSGADFYALLAACDVHLTFASTTLIEAAVLGKPNVGLSTPSTVDPAGYLEVGAFWPVHPSDVGGVVSKLVRDPEWQEQLLTTQGSFAAEWCLHDGKAVTRITDLIEDVALSPPDRRA